MSQVTLEDLVSLAKRRGFIYQGSEVYGGLSGTWDYGPLGVTLKRNIQTLWWKMFVEDRDDMYGVDAAILMNQKVWQASGHVDTFADPMIECRHCKSRFRTDHLVNEQDYHKAILKIFEKIKLAVNDESQLDDAKSIIEYYQKDNLPLDAKETINKILDKEKNDLEKLKLLNEQALQASRYLGFIPGLYLELEAKTKCPVCSKIEWGESRAFNMMFKTNAGPVESENSLVYLRPETAQGIFTNYKNIVDSFYPDLPFGIAQQGKAFRNEISPRDFVFRSREFEQMEIEYFVHPEKWEEAFEEWRKLTWEWCRALGLKDENVHELEVPAEDRAHYSKRTVDFEYDFPIGREELSGLAYRTDFDLGNIQRVSGRNMEYTIKGSNEKLMPHVIEPTYGVERAVMAVLSAAYTEDEINGEKRVYLKLPEHLAPVKYAVSPLLKNKSELVNKAREVYKALKKKHGAVMWDDNGNIGKRYRRQDEIGTPHCIVIDFQTLEDNTVTVRDRDTTEQKRVNTQELIG